MIKPFFIKYEKVIKLRALITFYKSFAYACIIISLACAWLVYLSGLSLLSYMFWFKAGTLVLVFYFIKNYKQKEIYYYANLGLSSKKLWVITLAFDMLLFLSLIILTAIFR